MAHRPEGVSVPGKVWDKAWTLHNGTESSVRREQRKGSAAQGDQQRETAARGTEGQRGTRYKR